MSHRSGIIWTDELIADSIMELANQFEPPRMPSRSETEEMRGDHALTCAISKHGGYAYWAKRLGLEQKYSETALGIEGEKTVADYLTLNGFEVKTTSVKHPYDLLVNGCVKVDVKTAKISYVKGYPIHSYRLAKRDHTCDFYIFFEYDTLKMYVVPACKLQGQVQVGMSVDSKAYQKYLGAFCLIKEAADMFQRM